MLARLSLCGALIVLGLGYVPQDDASSLNLQWAVILPQDSASSLIKQCTREVPSHIEGAWEPTTAQVDRKSTRLNSSHGYISYAVFCLKKKKKQKHTI